MIRIENVGKKFKAGTGEFWALKNVNLNVKKGEIVTILGPSGSGKSTLLNLVGGIDRADTGKIFIDKDNITDMNDSDLTKYRRGKIGFVFQFYNLIPNLTVYENIEVASNISNNPMNIDSLLKSIDMEDKKNKFPAELSGGEQQRVSIARAIVKNPDILLFDEPTGALDYQTSKEILKLIEKINNEFKTTMLIITHNSAIGAMTDRIVKLRSGEIVQTIDNKNKAAAGEVEW
jgi:putative ABC transport system ATP-binding protein